MLFQSSFIPMETVNSKPLEKVALLEEIILNLQKEFEKIKLENQFLKEQFALLTVQLYGKKSEKHTCLNGIPGQLNFFEPLEDEPEPVIEPEKTTIPEHSRKKKGRKPLPPELARIEVIHDIEESEKRCACGACLTRIGEERSEQLNYIPAKLEVIVNIRPKYACKSCEGLEGSGAVVKIAAPPKHIIPKSYATPELLAHIETAKFVDSLPFYRQEKQFSRLGFKLSRTNMINWTIQLIFLLQQEILSGSLIHMDETTVQVLKEIDRPPSSKSYMWVLHGGSPECTGTFFFYSPSRSAAVARELLDGYQGVVMTDGYSGYNFIDHDDKIEHAGCWAHARRKFDDVIKAKGKNSKPSHVEVAINYIAKLYRIETEAKNLNLSPAEIVKYRDEKSKPILDEFLKWLNDKGDKVPPKSLLGRAVNYTLGQWDKLIVYLNDGKIPIDNNPAENAVRPFVVGRKNWLFCDTPDGAVANARLYSLIETAKINNLNPTEYLKGLFKKLPYAENDNDLKALLPQYYQTATTDKK